MDRCLVAPCQSHLYSDELVIQTFSCVDLFLKKRIQLVVLVAKLDETNGGIVWPEARADGQSPNETMDVNEVRDL